MGDRSAIQWTDATWNALRGHAGKWHCVRVSEGCRNCYAASMNRRWGGPDYRAGADTPRLDAGVLSQPLRWRRPRRVFVCSMTDLFFEGHTNEQIAAVFGVMAAAPQHTFQVLTKRSARMREWFAWAGARVHRESSPVVGCLVEAECIVGRTLSETMAWPLPNVWLGVSAENQERLDERVPDLLACPAAVRWVSAEPLLGPLDFSPWSRECCCGHAEGFHAHEVMRGEGESCCDFPGCEGCIGFQANELDDSRSLDWIVVGGESGPGARPCDVAWVRSIVRQGSTAGVPVFVKQAGALVIDRNDAGFDAMQIVYADGPDAGRPTDKRAWPEPLDVEHDLDGTRDGYQGAPVRVRLRHPKGGDPDEWPWDLRVREWPSDVGAA